MIQDHFLCSSIFKIFHTWSSYFDFKINFYNTLCWYSGKDTGLSPERPQFKSLHYQAFLQKAFPWKFFKKWLSPRRIMIWPLKRGEIIRNPPLILAKRCSITIKIINNCYRNVYTIHKCFQVLFCCSHLSEKKFWTALADIFCL